MMRMMNAGTHALGIWAWENIAKPDWEFHAPCDSRPHEAIAAKRRWLDGTATDEELATAQSAAWDAVDEADDEWDGAVRTPRTAVYASDPHTGRIFDAIECACGADTKKWAEVCRYLLARWSAH